MKPPKKPQKVGSSFQQRMSDENLVAGKRMTSKKVGGKLTAGRPITGKEMTTDPWSDGTSAKGVKK